MSVLLETERLVLRAFAQSDLDDLARLDGDPQVMRYREAGKPHTREHTERETLPYLLAPRGRLDVWAWAALLKPARRFVGLFALRPMDDEGDDGRNEASLGYRLMPDVWGAGLASEGAKALVDRGFGVFGFDRIYGEAMAVNLGSRRVMEKAGLRYVRTFHVAFEDPIPGTEEGEVEYALTREEWAAERSGSVNSPPRS